jgi:hypothetical protein
VAFCSVEARFQAASRLTWSRASGKIRVSVAKCRQASLLPAAAAAGATAAVAVSVPICCLCVALLQVYAMSAGPACRSTLGVIVDKAEQLGILKESLKGRTLAGITPLHLLACWTPETESSFNPGSSSSSSSSRIQLSSLHGQQSSGVQWKSKWKQFACCSSSGARTTVPRR